MPKENEITLVVQCYDPSSIQIWSLRKQRSKHPTNTMAKHRVKVIKDQLWVRITRCSAMTDDLIPQFNTRYPEISSWAIR